MHGEVDYWGEIETWREAIYALGMGYAPSSMEDTRTRSPLFNNVPGWLMDARVD